MELPTLKKQVKAFLAGEEGKISKEKLVKIGVMAGLAASVAAADWVAAGHSSSNPQTAHTNTFELKSGNGGVYGEHQHAAFHTQHLSHSNHGSHSEGGWC